MQLQTRATPDRARIDVFDVRHLLGLNQEAFARRGAEILGTLNAVHPFREGNGTQREFVRKLAHKNGYWVIAAKCHAGNCISK
jgi:fido (protein-threonine AMPylation protein)